MAVVGTVEDIAGQFALHGEQRIGGVGGTVADISPNEIGKVMDVALDVLVDSDVHLHVHSFLLEVIFASLIEVRPEVFLVECNAKIRYLLLYVVVSSDSLTMFAVL